MKTVEARIPGYFLFLSEAAKKVNIAFKAENSLKHNMHSIRYRLISCLKMLKEKHAVKRRGMS